MPGGGQLPQTSMRSTTSMVHVKSGETLAIGGLIQDQDTATVRGTVVDADGKVRLLRARDRSKDQSYVLHVLTQRQLERALFPVGEYTKVEVRRLAEAFGLPSATRHDSQDLCFLAGGDYRDFLRRRQPEMLVPGEIVDSAGNLLGRHAGLANYTIGQRKGLNVGSALPLYVIRKETASNRLVVGEVAKLGTRMLTAGV